MTKVWARESCERTLRNVGEGVETRVVGDSLSDLSKIDSSLAIFLCAPDRCLNELGVVTSPLWVGRTLCVTCERERGAFISDASSTMRCLNELGGASSTNWDGLHVVCGACTFCEAHA